MGDTADIIKKSPAFDRKLHEKIIDKLKGNQILVYLFYLMALLIFILLLFGQQSWQNALVLIVLIVCFTVVIFFSYKFKEKT